MRGSSQSGAVLSMGQVVAALWRLLWGSCIRLVKERTRLGGKTWSNCETETRDIRSRRGDVTNETDKMSGA